MRNQKNRQFSNEKNKNKPAIFDHLLYCTWFSTLFLEQLANEVSLKIEFKEIENERNNHANHQTSGNKPLYGWIF